MFSRSTAPYWRYLLLVIAFIAILLAGRSAPAAAGQPRGDNPQQGLEVLIDSSSPVPLVPLNGSPPEALVCNGSTIAFETGIPPTWQVVDNTGGTGILWTTTADPACPKLNGTNGGGEAACADSDAAGTPEVPYDTEMVSNYFDLSTWDEVTLHAKAYYNDVNFNANDRFSIDVRSAYDAWNSVLIWDEDHMPGDINLSLGAYKGLATIQVRFRYRGDGFDWYAQVDDVSLTCRNFANINVDPLGMGSAQYQDRQVTQYLGISNDGGTPLHWQINEANSLDCLSPSFTIPWLSVAPFSGTTNSGNTTSIVVTFDSSGMSPGTYNGRLCITSDDPDPGQGNGSRLVPVSVEMVVDQSLPKVFLPYVSRAQ